jgi:MscS family membrane protein
MQRFLLFCIAAACAAILAWPLIAQETTPTPAPTAKPVVEGIDGDAVLGVAADLERRIENAVLGSEIPVLHHAFNAVMGVLRFEIFGLSLGNLLLSLLVLFISILFRNILSNAILKRIVRFARRKEAIDHRLVLALTRPLSFFLLLLGIYISLVILPFNPEIERLIAHLFRGLTMLAVVWGALMATDIAADQLESKFSGRPDSPLAGFAPLVKKTLKIFVLVIGVLMTIDNLGYNVTGILATLGLGTAAIALASQDTIKNAFGALMIVLDRPFKVGDWIQVGDKVDGDVESIGLRSTKVRTWPKTIISIPNGVLANEYINNWSRMPKRRVKQVVGITYEATARDMEELVEEIRDILRKDEGVQQDFILVNFTDFGESSLDILVYYFTTTIAWLAHMDIRQRINCKIMEAVNRRGLSIAFPCRSVYLEGPAASRLAELPYASRWDAPTALPGDSGPATPP